MSDEPFSQSRIKRYAKCQRLYEFDDDWEVNTINQSERYFDRGNVIHETIEDVCAHVASEQGLTDEEIREYALARTETHWETKMDRDEYYSAAEFDEDRQLTEARIESFFTDGPGIEHVRNSVATERYVQFERDGVKYHGYIDNIVKTAGGLTLVDYKTSSIDLPFYNEYTREHLDEGYRPARVKYAIQAAIYLEAIKHTDLYEEGMELDFVFYEMRYKKDVQRQPDTVDITIDGKARPVASGYQDQKSDVWELIEQAVSGIQERDFQPEPMEEIYDETCPGCSYKSICPEYLDEEVSRL